MLGIYVQLSANPSLDMGDAAVFTQHSRGLSTLYTSSANFQGPFDSSTMSFAKSYAKSPICAFRLKLLVLEV
uniref:Uncharacterized protein n=1 Tax=Physcomitrium patens TaxID=3218 RepID=A0A2K1KDA2_PHYPA|nr:hypothetical protein PHYPA_010944 [Physcomitrium patens]